MTLNVQPVNFDEACRFVAALHRHHRPPLGYRVCLGVNDGEKVVGVVIAGRPVSQFHDDGLTLEVNRCCTDGTRNACSILYAHAWKAARAMGYTRMITYTLPEEGGASLKAAGWKMVADVKGSTWNRPSRKRADDHPLGDKWRWEVTAGDGRRFAVAGPVESETPDLFSGVV
jgi:hypothetical protein